MTNLERAIPGFSDKIVTKLSASAQTSYRYTLNHQGAMLGWEMSADQLAEGRPGISGPIANLYLVGHWTQPGGGITPVILSAMRVAEAVISAWTGPERRTDGTLWPSLSPDASGGLPENGPGVPPEAASARN